MEGGELGGRYHQRLPSQLRRVESEEGGRGSPFGGLLLGFEKAAGAGGVGGAHWPDQEGGGGGGSQVGGGRRREKER